jgi:hypothetical protein
VPRVSSFELPISASHNHLLRVLPVVGCRSKTPTPAADAADDGNAMLQFAPTPPNCTCGPHGPVRPHRASPAATISPGIGAPGWNGPRSHGRRWNVRDHSTTTGRSSLRLVPRCSACFGRPRVYTQMWRCRSSRYVYSFRRSFHLLFTPT